ncbi:hypothetical protein ACIQBJ_03665 [Kitasatospora sp. NPDC088391]|uniref:hypothetical protein n=1 Tax=Kitasatospora sp. NPDC088391 TaxID=3364074 RepID=UPI00382BEC20
MDLSTLPRPRLAAPGPGKGQLGFAEAALVRHYRRLVCLAYLTLPADRGRHARVAAAHAAVQRSLPLFGSGGPTGAAEPEDDGYPAARVRVLRAALRRRRIGPPLPRVWGLRLFTPPDDEDAELDARLAELTAEVRAGFAVQALDGLDAAATAEVLAWAGAAEPVASARAGAELLALVGTLDRPEGDLPPGYDACSVHLRPGDLLRRRRRTVLLVAAATAAALSATVVPAVDRPGEQRSSATVTTPAPPERRADDLWRHTARLDLAVWPARGDRVDDAPLLERALTAWQRAAPGVPGVSAEPGSAAAGPAGATQLLYAGGVDGAGTVLLTDGRTLARYTEDGGGPALALGPAEDSDVTAGAAVVLRRGPGGARYLLAPWVAAAATRRLDRPDDAERPLGTAAGVTDPVPGPAAAGCAGPVLQLRSDPVVAEQHAFLLADLGGLTPAHLTWTPPPDASAPARPPREAVGAQALRRWAAGACEVPEAGPGVRQLNLWEFADQALPQNAGELAWVCLRADHWDGSGSAAAAVLPPNGGRAVRLGRAEGRACSRYEQDTVAQYRWRAPNGTEFLLVAASRRVARLTVGTARRRIDQAAPPTRTLALDNPGPGATTVEAVTAMGTRLRPIG